MKYDFEQAKQKVAERHGYESWGEYEYASFMKTGDTHDIWKESTELYADQFKIKLSPDRVVTQEEFNKQYSHYQDILVQQDVAGFWQESFNIADAERSKLKEVAPEPTEEDIKAGAMRWFSETPSGYIPAIWEAAIDWYKQKTNRK